MQGYYDGKALMKPKMAISACYLTKTNNCV